MHPQNMCRNMIRLLIRGPESRRLNPAQEFCHNKCFHLMRSQRKKANQVDPTPSNR